MSFKPESIRNFLFMHDFLYDDFYLRSIENLLIEVEVKLIFLEFLNRLININKIRIRLM